MKLEILTEGAANDRPALLFVHGAFCGAWAWKEHFLPHFAARGWQSAAVSLRGHGESEGAEQLNLASLSDFVEDVVQVAREFPRPPILLGHSLGGLIAQRAACRTPVSALAMLAPVGIYGTVPSFAFMSLLRPELLRQLALLQTSAGNIDYEVIRNGLFSPECPAPLAAQYAHRFQGESLRAQAELVLPQWFHLAQRPRLPTIVLGGAADAFIPASDMAVTATFWSAKLEILPGVPHVFMLDPHWARVAVALEQWLADLPGPGDAQ